MRHDDTTLWTDFSQKVTVPPWREAVTFLPLSGGTDCWSGCRWRGDAVAIMYNKLRKLENA